MSEERRDPSDEHQEARRLIDFRVLQLERNYDGHETRLRAQENAMIEVDGKLDTVTEKVDNVVTYLRENNAGGWRNFWTAVIGIIVVVVTVIGAHLYFK